MPLCQGIRNKNTVSLQDDIIKPLVGAIGYVERTLRNPAQWETSDLTKKRHQIKVSFYLSGREDLNLRSLGPEPSALASLSHAPNEQIIPHTPESSSSPDATFTGCNLRNPMRDGNHFHFFKIISQFQC